MTELRKLIEAATPGPWRAERDDFGPYITRVNLAAPGYDSTRAIPGHVGVGANIDDWDKTERNFDLIVYLVNHAEDIAALIEAAQKHGVCAERHHDGTHTGCDVDAQLSAALHPFEATP